MAVETTASQTALTFERVWTMFQETDKKFQAMSLEADKRQQENEKVREESRAEYDRRSAELDRKIEKMSEKVKELSENVGGMSNSLGDLAEGLMASDLFEKFEIMGLEFDHSIPNYTVKDKKTKLKLAEVDMLLVNGTIAMAIEVKTKMTKGDVDKHEQRMDILRREPNSLFANRVLYGAMAGVKMSEGAPEYALDKGFYVIELTGNMVKINEPASSTLKTW